MPFDIGVTPQGQQEVITKAPMPEANVQPASSSRDTYKYNPEYHQMADFLGVDPELRMDIEIAQKIAFLRDFTSEKEEVDAKLKLKNIMRELGVNMKGKELINHLYRYARLSQDRQKIDKEMSLLVEKPADVNGTQGQHTAVNQPGGA